MAVISLNRCSMNLHPHKICARADVYAHTHIPARTNENKHTITALNKINSEQSLLSTTLTVLQTCADCGVRDTREARTFQRPTLPPHLSNALIRHGATTQPSAQLHRNGCTEGDEFNAGNHWDFCSVHCAPTTKPGDCSELKRKRKKGSNMNNCENHLIVSLCVQPAWVQCSFCVHAPSR